MGIKDTSFGVKQKELLVTRHGINHIDMFLGKQIYIMYIVIYIVLITAMLSIGLFYLTQLRLFLGRFFEYLPLFIHYSVAVYP